MSLFEVGKKVICIKDSRKKIVKRGEIYELSQIHKGICSHSKILLDIGIKTEAFFHIVHTVTKD